MKTKKNLLKYAGEDKQRIRRIIAETINDEYNKDNTTSYLDFYGTGESFNYIKRQTKARILSIDNDPIIGKKLRNIPGTRYTSLADLCLEEREKFNTIWLDYCETLNSDRLADLVLLPRIMRNKGVLFLTYRNGREGKFLKGMARSTMEIGIHADIFLTFMTNFIKVNKCFGMKYQSFPLTKGKRKKKGGTAMKVYKFTWEKVELQSDFTLKRGEELLDISTI
jgi:hypothetical protein